MTTRQFFNQPALRALCLIVFFHLFGINAHALKVQQLTPLELLESAQLVVAVKVIPGPSPWQASVMKVLKAPSGQDVPGQIRFTNFSRTAKDIPIFDANQSHLLFLVRDGNEIYQCLSYGKQAIWPKKHLEWPYQEQHISTFDTALDAFQSMQSVLELKTTEEQDKRLSISLMTANPLLKSLAAEFLLRHPETKFLQSRAAMVKSEQSGGDRPQEPASSDITKKGQPRQPSTTALTPPEKNFQSTTQNGPLGASTLPQRNGISSTGAWIVFVLLIAGAFVLLVKRRS